LDPGDRGAEACWCGWHQQASGRLPAAFEPFPLLPAAIWRNMMGGMGPKQRNGVRLRHGYGPEVSLAPNKGPVCLFATLGAMRDLCGNPSRYRSASLAALFPLPEPRLAHRRFLRFSNHSAWPGAWAMVLALIIRPRLFEQREQDDYHEVNSETTKNWKLVNDGGSWNHPFPPFMFNNPFQT